MEFRKLNNTELEVTKPAPVMEPIKTVHNRRFIREQLKAIKASKDAFVTARNAEIAECQAILDEMDRVGVVEAGEVL